VERVENEIKVSSYRAGRGSGVAIVEKSEYGGKLKSATRTEFGRGGSGEMFLLGGYGR